MLRFGVWGYGISDDVDVCVGFAMDCCWIEMN